LLVEACKYDAGKWLGSFSNGKYSGFVGAVNGNLLKLADAY
jgi:hypothetical protein